MVYAPLERHTNQMQQAIQNCLDCHALCLNAVTYLLTHAGGHWGRPLAPGEPHPATVLLDCAEICQLSANYMLRGSADFAAALQMCTTLCHRAADTCDLTDPRDPHLRSTSDLCRRCAVTCQEMALQREETPSTSPPPPLGGM